MERGGNVNQRGLFIVVMRPPWQAVVPHVHSCLFWRSVKPTLSQTHPFSVKFDRAEPAADAYDDGGSNMHVVFDDVTFVSGFPAFRHNIPLLLLLCAIELVLLFYII